MTNVFLSEENINSIRLLEAMDEIRMERVVQEDELVAVTDRMMHAQQHVDEVK